jgi:hypothetical protein
VAARHKDWASFERWIAAYRALPQSFRRDHDACAIMNLEGMRALDDGRFDEAERIMHQVVEIAASVTFLSNAEVSVLAKRLRAEGRALALCDQFDTITQQRDWRLLTG